MLKSRNDIGYRPTWAEVDLGNLAYNFGQIKKTLRPKTKVMVTIKADAYGHGIIPVAKKLAALEVDYLGVASIDEGIKLRQENIRLPILVLGLILKKDIAPLFEHNLTQTVCTRELALALDRMGRLKRKRAKIHIKVDTGMGRIGVLVKDAIAFIKNIQGLKFVETEGMFTHLACADINNDFTLQQVDVFSWLVLELNRLKIRIPFLHAANSLGVVNFKGGHFNMVRPGLVIYGLYPQEGLGIELKPVLSLKTRVIYSKRVTKDCGISYGHTYISKDNTTIVTLPIGYGDGYPRNLSNAAAVLIRGRRFQVVGRVCMDQIMADAGDSPVKIGEEVVLIGSQGRNKITVEELAKLSGTIPYEIVCGIGSRVPRIYKSRA